MPTPTSSLSVADLPSLAAKGGESIFRVQGSRRAATGVPWRTADTLLTALGAVERDDKVDVTRADGTTFEVEVVGRDPSLDLALLRAQPGTLADAGASISWRPLQGLRIAEPVLALARPGQSVRAALGMLGVVGSSVRLARGGTLDRYVELDRQLPQGFSGSLVLDLAGEAIGIAMKGVVRGASLVLGDMTLERVVGQLEQHGHVRRGYIGVGVHPARLPTEIAERLGRGRALIVVALEDDGPASKAGVALGDVILAVDESAVSSPLELRAALEDRVSQRVSISLIRGGASTVVEVEPGTRHS
jgi:serine protease DegQ